MHFHHLCLLLGRRQEGHFQPLAAGSFTLTRLSRCIKVPLFICSQSVLSFFCDLVRLRNARLWSAVNVLTRDASRHSHEQMQTHGLRPPFSQPAKWREKNSAWAMVQTGSDIFCKQGLSRKKMRHLRLEAKEGLTHGRAAARRSQISVPKERSTAGALPYSNSHLLSFELWQSREEEPRTLCPMLLQMQLLSPGTL